MSSSNAIDKNAKSVWYIESKVPSLKDPLQGSAVLVEFEIHSADSVEHKKYLLTCRHVVSRVKLVEGKFSFDNATEIRCWRPNYRYSQKDFDNTYVARVSDLFKGFEDIEKDNFDEFDDWVLLEIDASSFRKLEANTVWCADKKEIPQDQLVIIGYPDGFFVLDDDDGKETVVASSVVDGLRRAEEVGDFAFDVTTQDTKPGMSGGGCFTSDGVLIGLHRQGIDKRLNRTEIRVDRIAAELRKKKLYPFWPNGVTRAAVNDPGDESEHRDYASEKSQHQIRVKGTIAKLESQIGEELDTISDKGWKDLQKRFDEDWKDGTWNRAKFVKWLIKEKEVRWVVHFNAVAESAEVADRTALLNVGRMYITLCFYRKIEKLRGQLRSGEFEIISSSCPEIAEVNMAAYDEQSVEIDGTIGGSAVEFLESGDFGLEDRGGEHTARAFMKDLLNATATRFSKKSLVPKRDSLEAIGQQLSTQIEYFESKKRRTIYCLIDTPEIEEDKKKLDEAIPIVAKYVPNLVFCFLHGQATAEEDFVVHVLGDLFPDQPDLND